MKKFTQAIACVILEALLLTACAPDYYDENNISELYDSGWIVGRSREEIVEKYGEFNREYISDTGKNLGAYYINYDNSGLDPSYIHDTYFIEFDDSDIAASAYFRKTSRGG